MKAYVATIKAKKGCLLGGVRIHKSAPMATCADATRWAGAVMSINQGAGRYPWFADIETVDVPKTQVCFPTT